MPEPIDIYSLIQPFVNLEIKNALKRFADDAKFSKAQIPIHHHTGVDSEKIRFEDLTGLPILSAAPTDKPENGTIRLYNAGGTRKIYAFISGTWYSATLT